MLILQDVHVLDGTGREATDATDVTIENGRIVDIGRARSGTEHERVDGRGRFVIPGLVQSHGHIMLEFDGSGRGFDSVAMESLRAAKRAARMLQAGITTFRDMSGYMGIEIVLKKAIQDGLVPGPRLVCAGRRLAMTGGFFHMLGAEVDGPDALRRAVRENLKSGSEIMKFVAAGGPNPRCHTCEPGGPEYSEEELRAGADEARRFGVKSAAHVVGPTSILNSVKAGIDTLEHAPYLEPEVVALMREKGTSVVPTLSVYHRIVANKDKLVNYPVSPKWAEQALEASARSLKLAQGAELTMGMGTDAGTLMNPHTDMATEFRLWVDAGLSFRHALRAATLGGATICGLQADVGSIERGKFADLVLLDGDPERDIGVLERPWRVYQAGREVRA